MTSDVIAPATIVVRTAVWSEDAPALQALRHEVFVVGQSVPQALEADGRDPMCKHVLAVDALGAAIGCARLLPDGHIGRMAVRAPWRRRGVGASMLEHLVGLAHARGDRKVVLNAQTHALAFYERHGFVAVGPPFEEAGILHVAMELSLRGA